LIERPQAEGNALAHRLVVDARSGPGRLTHQAAVVCVEIKFNPLCAGERPFMLMTLNEFLFRVTDKELHPRLFAPASILSFQKNAEEPLLQPDTIIRIELQPVGAAMRLEPFLL